MRTGRRTGRGHRVTAAVSLISKSIAGSAHMGRLLVFLSGWFSLLFSLALVLGRPRSRLVTRVLCVRSRPLRTPSPKVFLAVFLVDGCSAVVGAVVGFLFGLLRLQPSAFRVSCRFFRRCNLTCIVSSPRVGAESAPRGVALWLSECFEAFLVGCRPIDERPSGQPDLNGPLTSWSLV